MLRVPLTSALVAVLLAVLPLSSARGEDDCGGCARRCSPERDRCAPRRAYGRAGSWALLSAGIRHDRIPRRHRHPRHFFLRRFPWTGHTCDDLERGPSDCPLVCAALEEDDAPRTAARHLSRGLERFVRGARDGARADFEAALATEPEDARPRFGLLFVEILDHDWHAAAARLDELAAHGDLRADDRVVVEDVFDDPKGYEQLLAGLASYTQWHFDDADAQRVAAWAFASAGRESEAAAHRRAAARFRSRSEPSAQRP